jgi:hypothetical protein
MRTIFQSAVWPDMVIFSAPMFDHNYRLLEGEEDFKILQLISQLAVEALYVAIFPGITRLDVQPFGFEIHQPGEHFFGKLRTIIGMNTCTCMQVQGYIPVTPHLQKSSVKHSLISSAFSFQATLIARHSREYSSITFSIRKGSQSWVTSMPKLTSDYDSQVSTAHTSHHSATTARVSIACGVILAIQSVKCALPACDMPPLDMYQAALV